MPNILVLPRKCVDGLDGFVPWVDAIKIIDSVESYANWLPREEAELSEQWVQPIPCAIFRNDRGQYCVFRQARQQGNDLSLNCSFIVGGHIDSFCDRRSTCEVFEDTVRREVLEEVMVTLDSQLKPIGMVIDSSSIMASRHIALVYEATVDRKLKSLAGDEFSVRSKYNGEFFDIESISELRFNSRRRLKFDPWSLILLSQYLDVRFSKDMGRQSKLPMFLE